MLLKDKYKKFITMTNFSKNYLQIVRIETERFNFQNILVDNDQSGKETRGNTPKKQICLVLEKFYSFVFHFLSLLLQSFDGVLFRSSLSSAKLNKFAIDFIDIYGSKA